MYTKYKGILQNLDSGLDYVYGSIPVDIRALLCLKYLISMMAETGLVTTITDIF